MNLHEARAIAVILRLVEIRGRQAVLFGRFYIARIYFS